MKKTQYKNTPKFTSEVIEEIVEVQEQQGLTPENLLRKASKKSSNLYGFFDWDNSQAGEKWRIQQARLLINEVKVIVEDKEMFAFENISIEVCADDEDGEKEEDSKIVSSREYKPIVEIMNKKEYRNQLIERALSEAMYWKDRHQELIELNPIFCSIDKIKTKWQKK